MSAGFLSPDAQQPQPWDRLADYLAGQGFGISSDPLPRQFAGGFGNLNYLIELDGKPAVLRTPPAGPLPPGGNDMGRESRVLTGLWKAFPLAPRCLHFCDDTAILEHPFFIMDYREGFVVAGDSLPEILKDAGRTLSELMIDVLARFHAVDPAAVDLDTLGRPEGFLDRAVAGWIKRAHVASADIYDDRLPPKAALAVADWLQAQPVPPGDVTLLHNDFKLDNILLDPDAPTTPVAVLDWDMCTRGDPLFDLATLLSYWSQPDDPRVMFELGQMPTANPGFLSRQQALDLYADTTGRDVSSFLFHRVLTMMKLGVVFLQIYARHCRGTTQDPRIAELGGLAEGVFEFGHEIAQGRAF